MSWNEATDSAIERLRGEIEVADEKYGPFTSAHEGYGVLAEEVDELLQAIRKNELLRIEHEALQVAAVALRLRISMNEDATRARSGCEE